MRRTPGRYWYILSGITGIRFRHHFSTNNPSPTKRHYADNTYIWFRVTNMIDLSISRTCKLKKSASEKSRGFYLYHDDVIKSKHFPCYWPFMWGFHRSPVNCPKKSQWRGSLMCSLICAWTNAWINNQDDGYLRRHRAHYEVTVMCKPWCLTSWWSL